MLAGDRTTCGGNPDGHPHHAPDALGVGGSALLVLQEPIGRLPGHPGLAEHTDKSAAYHPRVSESHDMAFVRLVRAKVRQKVLRCPWTLAQGRRDDQHQRQHFDDDGDRSLGCWLPTGFGETEEADGTRQPECDQ